MSAKKKQPTFSECPRCGCSVLVKDAQKHPNFCGKPLGEWEISVVRPKDGMRGFICEVDKVIEYIPPDSVGWSRSHSVLINPQTMELLGANPRQPVRISGDEKTIVGTLWPCKEVGALKIALSSRLFLSNDFCHLEVVTKWRNVDRLEISLSKTEISPDQPLLEYLEAYLSNCFIEPDVPIAVNYYGKTIDVVAQTPLEIGLQDMTLEEGELAPEMLHTSSYCTLTISGLETVKKNNDGGDKMSEFNAIGGMHSVKEVLSEYVLTPFLREGSCCSVLMWGLPGSGKSFVLQAAARVLGSSSFYFKSMDEFSERATLIPRGCVVILDWPSVEKEHKAFPQLIDLLTLEKAKAVILSVREADDLQLGVRVRFPIEVEIDVPNEAERLEILRCMLDSTSVPESCTAELAKRTHGFTAGDLHSLVTASRFAPGSKVGDRLETTRRRIRPTGIRQFILEVPDVKWNDIGGNEELKLEIQQAVIWPQIHKETFEKFGIDPPSGILLYGPPGCSKTLVARALANESKMNFLAVKGPELFSKWVGESEKAIRDLFARARQVAPTIVFFDEIDAVGASRGSEKSSGVSDRVLAQLLTELDGLEKNSGVILLAATNRPDQLDSALLRPGRLDRSIHVGLPTPSTRKAILEMRMKKMTSADDVQLETLIQRTEGYSGAELVAVCRNAALVAMREDLNATMVHWRHFEETLKAIVPRTEKYLLDIYEQFEQGCVS